MKDSRAIDGFTACFMGFLLDESRPGSRLPANMEQSLPEIIHKRKAILWDRQNPGFLYVFDIPADNQATKAIIRVNNKTNSKPQVSARNATQSNTLTSTPSGRYRNSQQLGYIRRITRTNNLLNSLNLSGL